jgi:hypothetical protein
MFLCCERDGGGFKWGRLNMAYAYFESRDISKEVYNMKFTVRYQISLCKVLKHFI